MIGQTPRELFPAFTPVARRYQAQNTLRLTTGRCLCCSAVVACTSCLRNSTPYAAELETHLLHPMTRDAFSNYKQDKYSPHSLASYLTPRSMPGLVSTQNNVEKDVAAACQLLDRFRPESHLPCRQKKQKVAHTSFTMD